MHVERDTTIMAALDELEIRHWLVKAETSGGRVISRRFGERVVAFITHEVTSSLESRALGFGPADHLVVADVVKWYQQHGRIARLDLQPQIVSERYRDLLRGLGMSPGGLAYFGRRLRFGTRWPQPIGVRAVAGMDCVVATEQHASAYVELKREARQLWPMHVESERQHVLATLSDPRFARYMLVAGERPVAYGEMFVHEAGAWFSGAATLESHRGRGAQSWLIALRLQRALASACTLVGTLVQPDSQSDRNLCNAGFDQFVDRELWMPDDWMQRMPGSP